MKKPTLTLTWNPAEDAYTKGGYRYICARMVRYICGQIPKNILVTCSMDEPKSGKKLEFVPKCTTAYAEGFHFVNPRDGLTSSLFDALQPYLHQVQNYYGITGRFYLWVSIKPVKRSSRRR
jgi:hypothetical protein